MEIQSFRCSLAVTAIVCSICLSATMASALPVQTTHAPASQQGSTESSTSGVPVVGKDVSLPALKAWDDGVRLSQAGQFGTAVPFFSAAIKLSPRFTFAWEWRAAAYLQLNEFSKAVDDAKTAMQLDPCESRPYLVLAFARQRQARKVDNIQKYVERCEERHPARAAQLKADIDKAARQVESLLDK